MSKNELDSVYVPRELALILRKEIKDSRYKKIPRFYLACLDKHIDTLKKEDIVDPGDSNIKIKEYKSAVDIYKGKFTLDVIKGVLYKQIGMPNLIKAMLIAHYAGEWKEVYDKYYNKDNSLKIEYEVKKKKKQKLIVKSESGSNILQNTEIRNNGNEKIGDTDRNNISAGKSRDEEKFFALKSGIKKGWIVLSALIFLVFIFNYFTKKQATDSTEIINNRTIHFDSTKYNILILPFNNPDNDSGKSDVGEDLAIKLKQNKKYDTSRLDIEYLPSDTIARCSDVARIISKKIKNTSIIIWGTDSKPPDSSHQIYFHYTNLISEISNTSIPDEGVTEKFETYRLSNITEGEMHFEIEDIINWFLANYYLNECNYIQAINNYKEIEKYSKNLNYDLYFSLAYCFAKMDSLQIAKYYCEKSLDTKPNPNYFSIQTYYALILEKIDPVKASKYYKEISGKYANNFYIRDMYSNLSPVQHQIIFAMERYYNGALKIHSDNFTVQVSYAHFLSQKGNYDEAKKHFILAFKIDPYCPSLYFDYSQFLWLKGDQNLAKKFLRMGLKHNPKEVWLHLLYAYFLEESGEMYDARTHYRIALYYDSQNAMAHQLYAYFLIKIGDYIEATKQFRIALKIDPKFLAFDHILYAFFLVRHRHDFNTAKEHYLTALKIDSSYKSNYIDSCLKITN